MDILGEPYKKTTTRQVYTRRKKIYGWIRGVFWLLAIAALLSAAVSCLYYTHLVMTYLCLSGWLIVLLLVVNDKYKVLTETLNK